MAKAKKSEDVRRACIEAALDLARTTPWGHLTLARICKTAGLSLENVHGTLTKQSLSNGIERYFDKAMSEGAFDDEETARTRLFDVIMMRFDAMETKREGVLSYLKWRDRSLSGLRARFAARAETARWALVCTGLDGDGRIPIQVRILGLARVISQAEAAWKTEDSADLSKTMARLDAELLKIEERIDWFVKRTGSKATETDPADVEVDQ